MMFAVCIFPSYFLLPFVVNKDVHNCVNPLDAKGNYNATSNNTKLVHWPLMGGLLHLVQQRGAWAGPIPSSLYQM